MIGDTLTKKNLLAIAKAMAKIKKNDRSDYFNKYYVEVRDRLSVIDIDSEKMKNKK